jgi:cellulose synthase/poly-beta-1,6-N-acetylglucosamine synthase-like glycosyltransferase
VQRNAAIRQAQGELIYFLDDDACPQRGALRAAVAHFRQPKVSMAGGPNLCPPEATRLEKIFAMVLSSWLAFGPSRARYRAVGTTRISGEKELILCNLVARRSDLLEAGGFDEALYPNEENALMDQMQKLGKILLYDPSLVVYRRPRSTLWAFGRMLLTYGRGRAEQFRRHPTLGSALNFAPPLFVVYVALLSWWGGMWSVPLAIYLLGVVLQTVVSARSQSGLEAVAAAPLVILTHLLYGLGFLRGLLTRLKSRNPGGSGSGAEVEVEIRKHLGASH